MSTLAIRPLNSDLQVVAKEELNEETEKIQEFLETIREWIKKSTHLKARTDDQFLVNFLRGCKFSLETTKKKIDMFYTLRTHIPELIVGRDPLEDKTLEIIRLGFALPMPYTETPGSPRLMLMRPGAYDASKYTIQDTMKVATMINDILLLEDDNFMVAGQIGVCDLKGVTIQHFIQMQPAFVKKMTMMMQEGSPIRQKGMHYINVPASFEQIFNLFKSFLNEKMKSRVS